VTSYPARYRKQPKHPRGFDDHITLSQVASESAVSYITHVDGKAARLSRRAADYHYYELQSWWNEPMEKSLG
jgi:hypothetical protein